VCAKYAKGRGFETLLGTRPKPPWLLYIFKFLSWAEIAGLCMAICRPMHGHLQALGLETQPPPFSSA